MCKFSVAAGLPSKPGAAGTLVGTSAQGAGAQQQFDDEFLQWTYKASRGGEGRMLGLSQGDWS